MDHVLDRKVLRRVRKYLFLLQDFQYLSEDSGNANDNCVSGFLHLFNPSSTTFVKHFISTIAEVGGGDSQLKHNLIAGYINTTSAIDEVQFKMSSGNIDAGDICLYGIK